MIKERFEYVYNALIKYFDIVFTNVERLEAMNEQFFNVLGNCDEIKYDKIGTIMEIN